MSADVDRERLDVDVGEKAAVERLSPPSIAWSDKTGAGR
jgi:hypothetical protein